MCLQIHINKWQADDPLFETSELDEFQKSEFFRL